MSSVNIYLKIKLAKAGLVKGNATASGHTDEIILDSFRWGEQSHSMGGKGTSSVRDFEFSKKMCPGSIPLLLACYSCDSVVEAIVSVRGNNTTEKVDFLKWTLTDGAISLFELETMKDSVVPMERACIRFRTLVVEHKPRQEDGSLGGALTARIDVGANTSSS